MAVINDLVSQIENKELRVRIENELARMAKQKKFGLVFEEHLPECTPLYDIPVRRGSVVALRSGKMNDVFFVTKIDGTIATCIRKEDRQQANYSIIDLVPVAEFGEPIYPCLKMLDSVCNAPDSDLWHALIEADNYHALQLLEYLYAGKVDCIYIDPPYNTGARDWKYNNDYVDGTDSYRHSKWLSMMKKRLKLAKRLLNPKNSVLIVTIDEKEYLHLGCLLEELFPEARIQMISSLINPTGVSRGMEFARTDEYIFFVMNGVAGPSPLKLSNEWIVNQSEKSNAGNISTPFWRMLRRSGTHDERWERPNTFFPIYVDKETGRIIKCGESLPANMNRELIHSENDQEEIVWPIKTNGHEGCWQLSQDSIMKRLEAGYIRTLSRNQYGWVITYLAEGEIQKIQDGIYTIEGRGGSNNELHVKGGINEKSFVAGTQWNISSHSARHHGSLVLNNVIGEKRFSFPKSLYAVHDAIRFFVEDKPNALIVDFFAGSGTTLHAVNLLNAEDGGHRRCILVTNNEVSADEAKSLTEQGYHPGDDEWNRLGIARYVTWPRTVCSIKGHDINKRPLKGNYLGTEIAMSEGFKTNAVFFKLGFLDKTAVALGLQFKEMLPTLWMKAGAFGPCPVVSEILPESLVLPENKFAVLIDEKAFTGFLEAIEKHPEIQTVYIVTDSEAGYRDMISHIEGKETFQLYRDYLDNFRINSVRR